MSTHHELAIRQLSPFPLLLPVKPRCPFLDFCSCFWFVFLLSSLTAGNGCVLFWLWWSIYGWPGFWGAGKTVGRWLSCPGGPYRQVPRVTIRSFANVLLSVEIGSDGPYVSVGSICPSLIADTGRMRRILQGSDWLCQLGVRHHRSYHSPSLERPARSFCSLPLRTFGCHR